MEPNLDAALSLGKQFWLNPGNWKNLEPADRVKVKDLMTNLKDIASGKAQSPFTPEEAHAILVKIRTSDRIAPLSGKLTSAWKKMTSSQRITVPDLKRSQQQMYDTIRVNDELKKKLQSASMPSVMGEVIPLQDKAYFEYAGAATTDMEQLKRLANFTDDVTWVNSAEIQAHKKEWLQVLEAILKFKPKGDKSESYRGWAFALLILKLSQAGVIDEEFKRKWNAKEFGPTAGLDYTKHLKL
jgi:hypothetical protein